VTARLYSWADRAALVEALRSGAVAVLPTDTLYGLSCVAHHATALGRIRKLKGADDARAFVTLVANPDEIEPWLDREEQDPRAWRFACAAWPAPFTAVVAVRDGTPGSVPEEEGRTLAVRVPAHAELRALLAALGSPIVSTSVNAHGTPPLAAAAAILATFGEHIDVLVRDDRAGSARPSTLADCRTWPPQSLRPGAFDLEAAIATAGTPPPEWPS
jgi:L-threonylcarbamoyladenylate synthase